SSPRLRLGSLSLLAAVLIAGVAVVLHSTIGGAFLGPSPGSVTAGTFVTVVASVFLVGATVNTIIATLYDLILRHHLRGRGALFLRVRGVGSCAYMAAGVATLLVDPFPIAVVAFALLAVVSYRAFPPTDAPGGPGAGSSSETTSQVTPRSKACPGRPLLIMLI